LCVSKGHTGVRAKDLGMATITGSGNAFYCIVLEVDVLGKREVIFVRGSFLKFSEKDSNCHWAFVQKVHLVKIIIRSFEVASI
jgi:hypothetical protein